MINFFKAFKKSLNYFTIGVTGFFCVTGCAVYEGFFVDKECKEDLGKVVDDVIDKAEPSQPPYEVVIPPLLPEDTALAEVEHVE